MRASVILASLMALAATTSTARAGQYVAATGGAAFATATGGIQVSVGSSGSTVRAWDEKLEFKNSTRSWTWQPNGENDPPAAARLVHTANYGGSRVERETWGSGYGYAEHYYQSAFTGGSPAVFNWYLLFGGGSAYIAFDSNTATNTLDVPGQLSISATVTVQVEDYVEVSATGYGYPSTATAKAGKTPTATITTSSITCNGVAAP